jgi:hypothetical protein
MPGDPQFCRKQARRCADMWAVTKNPKLRKSLEDLEVKWLQLALDLEKARAIIEALEANKDD